MLRKWTENDLSAICELEKQCFIDPWSLEMLKGEFELNGFLGYLIEENGEIVAYAGFSSVLDEGNLDLIAVSENHRRKGYAKQLANKAFSELVKNGVTKVFLEVRKKNAAAISLYELLGFNRIGERLNYYGNDDAVMMVKFLEENL